MVAFRILGYGRTENNPSLAPNVKYGTDTEMGREVSGQTILKNNLRKLFSPRTWADAIFSRLIPGYYKEWQKRNPT